MNIIKLKEYLESNKEKKFTGLLGSPVAHSLSPFIHKSGFEALGMTKHEYVAIECLPDGLLEMTKVLKDNGFMGFNVTMPDKQAIIGFCDELSDEAELIESVNTVKIEDGKLKGYNTDCSGFFKALQKNGEEPEGKKFMLLGAGGAAKAILAGAVTNKAESIDVFARAGKNFKSIEELASRLEKYQKKEDLKTKISFFDFADEKLFEERLSMADVLVNATNVGMNTPETKDVFENETLVKNPALFSKKQFAADVIYHPKETKLLKDAKSCGCHTMNGLYMLFYQADLAFYIWHQKYIPENVLEELMEK